MPYVNRESRVELNWDADTPGELNYLITQLSTRYLNRMGTSYTVINDIIGAMECAKQEFYRRVAVPYEEKKMKENGDVYEVGE